MANFQSALNGAMLIAVIVVGALVGIQILADLAPSYFTSVADLVGVFTDPNTTTNSSAADALLSPFGLILALSGVGAIIALAFLVFRLRGGSNRGG